MSEATRIDAIRVMDRHRKDFGDIEALAASIKDVGMLQPVVITPDLRLVAGERRLRAARSLGWVTIPTRVVGNLTDATAALRAERDENTCRKPMTPEELVNIGLEIERLERPKAQARQAEGGRAGAESRWGDGLGPAGPKPSEKPEPNRTAAVVGDALGVSTNTYKRAKHVVQTARGDNHPTPEVQEVAQKALDEMNAGRTTITTGYNKVREARGSKKPDRLAMPQPPRFGGNRKKHVAQIDSLVVALSGANTAFDHIRQASDLDASVTSEEAARLVGDLSREIQSLNRIKNLIKERTK